MRLPGVKTLLVLSADNFDQILFRDFTLGQNLLENLTRILHSHHLALVFKGVELNKLFISSGAIVIPQRYNDRM